ncbi:peptidoglycan-binding domain-containing protein [Kitasatospora purpeofusca]|uniref:peptidoglycan-binding domain-containing protein n=1 Tax=Kitasatospora purpeofusca TaxID=67352 RepID=UPI00380A09CD
MTDAQLQVLLPATSPGQGAVDDLTRRYGDVILACVRELGATAEDARELSAEALARTVDACDRAEPGPCWLVPLLGEARYLAAGRAGTGRRDSVAPGFLHWLDQRAAGNDGLRAALSAAEEESLLLRSFAGLTEPWAAQLWWGLVAPPGADAPLGSDAPPVAARRTLADAYVRLHVATVAERRCRHLAAALAEQATGDGPATAEAVRHLARCPRCGTVLADLAAVHHWDADHLLRGLLIRFDAPAAGAVPVPVPPAPRTADSARSPHRAKRWPGAAGHLPTPVRRWGVGAVAGMGLAVVVLALPPGEDLVPDPPAVGTATAAGPSSPVPAAPSPAPVAGRPLRTSLPTPSTTGRRSGPASAPSRTPTAALPTPAPPVASAATSPTPTASPKTTSATTPTPTAVPTVRTLRRGDTGSDVVRMQDLLIRVDCVPESVPFADGGFDDATARFLRSFQRAAGIAGKEFDRREYGPQSRQALEGAGDRAVCSGA